MTDISWNVSVLKFRLIFTDKPFNPLYFPLYLSYSFSFWNLLISHNVLHSMTLFVLDACFVECELIHPKGRKSPMHFVSNTIPTKFGDSATG